MNVTVYAKPGCPQCVQTRHEMDRFGIPYATVDLATNPTQRARLIQAGWRAAPVVETDLDAWSGYQPERIRGLANAAMLETAV